MKDENLKYGFEHWMDLHVIGKAIKANMIEIPEGDVAIGGKVFHVGAFMISKSLVTGHSWDKVMGQKTGLQRKPITGVSYVELSDYLQRLRVPWKWAGHLTIPTEAQLEMARQKGIIRPIRKYKEICLTQYRAYADMGNHHFFDNLPKAEPFDLVVRGTGADSREPLSNNRSNDETGFRLVLVDYSDKHYEDLLESLKEGIQ